MKSIKTTSWEDFLEKKDEILSEYKAHTIGNTKISIPILFRGQSNSNWKLNSTLERQSDCIICSIFSPINSGIYYLG